eukprot:scaffold41066_cov31-Tisochrysis_lutea.AAC.1
MAARCKLTRHNDSLNAPFISLARLDLLTPTPCSQAFGAGRLLLPLRSPNTGSCRSSSRSIKVWWCTTMK